jgi:DNA repair exonuclease SbcCD ATPase subunit
MDTFLYHLNKIFITEKKYSKTAQIFKTACKIIESNPGIIILSGDMFSSNLSTRDIKFFYNAINLLNTKIIPKFNDFKIIIILDKKQAPPLLKEHKNIFFLSLNEPKKVQVNDFNLQLPEANIFIYNRKIRLDILDKKCKLAWWNVISCTVGQHYFSNEKFSCEKKTELDYWNKYLNNVDDDMKRKVIDLYTSENKTQPNKVNKWTINFLRWRGLYTYVKDSWINFDEYNGNIISIAGKNSAGKSSIMDIICFALFNKTIRGNHKDMINNTSLDYEVSCYFTINETKYFIYRKGTKNRTGNYLLAKYDKEWININQKNICATYNYIGEQIGSFDDFININLCPQMRIFWTDKKNVDRTKALINYLNLNKYEPILNKTKNKITKLKAAKKYISKPEKIDEPSPIDENLLCKKQDELKKCYMLIDYSISTKPEKFVDVSELIGELEKLLEYKYHQLYKLPDNVCSIDNTFDVKKYKQIKEQVKNKCINKCCAQHDWHFINNFVKKHQHLIEKEQEINVQLAEIEEKIAKKESLDDDFLTTFDLQSNIKKTEELKAVKARLSFEDNCSSCNKNKADIVSNINDCENNIKKYEKLKAAIYEENKDKINSLYNELKVQKNNILKVQKFRHCLSFLEYKDNVKYIKNNRNKYQSRKYSLQLQHNNEVEKCIKDIKHKIQCAKYTINQKYECRTKVLEQEISHLTSMKDNKKKYDEYVSDLEEYNKKIQTIDDELNALEIYFKCLDSRKGVPFMMLSESCEIIEKHINNMLSGIVDFKIKLSFDKVGESRLLIEEKNKLISSDVGSGFQKFMIDLLFRYALSQLNNISLPNFFIIDEGFGVLDDNNTKNVFKVISKIRVMFDFLIIINHVDYLKQNTSITNLNNHQINIGKELSYMQICKHIKIDTNEDDLTYIKEDGKDYIMCQVCNKKILNRKGAADRHVSSKTHLSIKKKHNL